MTVKELIVNLIGCDADENVLLEDDVEFIDGYVKVSGSCYQIEKVIKCGRSVSLHFDNRRHFMREQEPCEDCISRQAVINALYALCDTGETTRDNPWRDNPHIDTIIETVEQLPPVKLQEPMTGKWEYTTHYGSRYRVCPKCNIEREDDCSTGWNYCPNCGAKMVESEGEKV